MKPIKTNKRIHSSALKTIIHRASGKQETEPTGAVDKVESGNMNPVTSNAVASELNSALSSYAPIIKRFNSNSDGTTISFEVADLGLYRITVYRGNYMSIYYATYIGGSTSLILQYNTSANPVASTSVSGRIVTLTLATWGYVCGVIERLK